MKHFEVSLLTVKLAYPSQRYQIDMKAYFSIPPISIPFSSFSFLFFVFSVSVRLPPSSCLIFFPLSPSISLAVKFSEAAKGLENEVMCVDEGRHSPSLLHHRPTDWLLPESWRPSPRPASAFLFLALALCPLPFLSDSSRPSSRPMEPGGCVSIPVDFLL